MHQNISGHTIQLMASFYKHHLRVLLQSIFLDPMLQDEESVTADTNEDFVHSDRVDIMCQALYEFQTRLLFRFAALSNVLKTCDI